MGNSARPRGRANCVMGNETDRESDSGGETPLSDAELRLQALNLSKDKLLSVVGHDLRSTIGGVTTLVNMLEQKLDAGETTEARRLAGLIRRAALDADELLTDLVDWTRSHGQDIPFRLTELDLVELARAELERVRPGVEGKGLSLRVDAPEKAQARADRNMLQAILRNLITNALKFSHKGGEMTITIARRPGEWLVEVGDTGVGMPPELQERILKIDSRKQRAGTSGETGSGFGLLLCEDFVQRHGGRLYWASSPGEGSTFGFTLPELVG